MASDDNNEHQDDKVERAGSAVATGTDSEVVLAEGQLIVRDLLASLSGEQITTAIPQDPFDKFFFMAEVMTATGNKSGAAELYVQSLEALRDEKFAGYRDSNKRLYAPSKAVSAVAEVIKLQGPVEKTMRILMDICTKPFSTNGISAVRDNKMRQGNRPERAIDEGAIEAVRNLCHAVMRLHGTVDSGLLEDFLQMARAIGQFRDMDARNILQGKLEVREGREIYGECAWLIARALKHTDRDIEALRLIATRQDVGPNYPGNLGFIFEIAISLLQRDPKNREVSELVVALVSKAHNLIRNHPQDDQQIIRYKLIIAGILSTAYRSAGDEPIGKLLDTTR
ncbi:MAG: hypothetical protein UY05_C0017G0003 [Candidatus Peregrinibacteria bacterium GW2011_GWA2_47_7]|nr:MAG: hypothetical protein UY05_C0017G0003 [Candidatus Peregrinibacteria bacterium GW2011_GWA2_47_7]